ncbi:MAG: twin-arginine translocase subunit TatB [Rhodobacter sp.]|nr:twin-arginine translocase subunit TatB [Rhodobacter sp.]
MDLSWSELLVVGIVALIFIGPKDLPGMFRELGRFMAKVRSMGREFSRAMDAAAKESGVKDVADDLRKVASPRSMGMDAVRSAADKFEKWDPLKPAAAKPAATAAAAAPAVDAAPAAKMGPATAALAGKVAERKAASAKTTARLREAAVPAPEPAPTPKRGGRVRKKADTSQGDKA